MVSTRLPRPTRRHCWVYVSHDMGPHMKTTVELPDALLADARALAERDGTTLKALLEAGLRHVVKERKRRAQRVPPRVVTFGGDGLQPGVTSFEDMQALSYLGRGS